MSGVIPRRKVQKVIPQSVVRDQDGYLRVFYNKVRLKFQTYDQWIASGAGRSRCSRDVMANHDIVASLRRTKATLISRRTGNLRAVQFLLGHTKIESTVRWRSDDLAWVVRFASNFSDLSIFLREKFELSPICRAARPKGSLGTFAPGSSFESISAGTISGDFEWKGAHS